MEHNAYQIRREQWRQIVNACNNRKEFLSKKEWCRQNGIHIKSFYYWQHQFRCEAELSIMNPPAVAEMSAPSFVDITSKLSSSIDEKVIPDETASSLVPEIMIQIRDCRIYVSNAVSERTLDLVMRSIRHA